MVDILYWEKNEKKSKKFLKNLYNFTSANFRLVIKQKTRKIRTLLPVKEKTFSLHIKCTMIYVTVVLYR